MSLLMLKTSACARIFFIFFSSSFVFTCFFSVKERVEYSLRFSICLFSICFHFELFWIQSICKTFLLLILMIFLCSRLMQLYTWHSYICTNILHILCVLLFSFYACCICHWNATCSQVRKCALIKRDHPFVTLYIWLLGFICNYHLFEMRRKSKAHPI